MPEVSISLLAAPTDGRRKATISSTAGLTTLPIASPASDWDGLAGEWVEIKRPGKAPLLIRAGEQLVTEALTVTLVPRTEGQVVDDVIAELATHARADEVIVAYGSLEAGNRLNPAGRWVIDSLQVSSEERTEGNDVSLGTARIGLKQTSPVA